MPDMVDGHTHPIWVGDGVHEFATKLAGAICMEAHTAEGGILFTVKRTREANEAEPMVKIHPMSVKEDARDLH